MRQELDEAYRNTAARLPSNEAVRIEKEKRRHPKLIVSNLEKIDDPPSLTALRDTIQGMLRTNAASRIFCGVSGRSTTSIGGPSIAPGGELPATGGDSGGGLGSRKPE